MTVISHKRTQEKPASTGSGGFLLVLALAGFLASAAMVIQGIVIGETGVGDDLSIVLHIVGGIAITLLSVLVLSGLYSLQQNESAAITLFGIKPLACAGSCLGTRARKFHCACATSPRRR